MITQHTPKIQRGRYGIGKASKHKGDYMRKKKNIKRKTLRLGLIRLSAAFTALEHISLGIYMSYKTKTITLNLILINLSLGLNTRRA